MSRHFSSYAHPNVQSSISQPCVVTDRQGASPFARYLDIFNVMAYDYHGSWETFTGHVSPPYMSPLDVTNEMETFNVVSGHGDSIRRVAGQRELGRDR